MLMAAIQHVCMMVLSLTTTQKSQQLGQYRISYFTMQDSDIGNECVKTQVAQDTLSLRLFDTENPRNLTGTVHDVLLIGAGYTA